MTGTADIRTETFFHEMRDGIFRRTDHMFATLMIIQWAFGMICALTLSPKAWEGATSYTHPHVWAALFMGGALSAFPIAMAIMKPGEVYTRHIIAISQMLWSALLIHLTGGRIETHFHVFGSLAFLAIYRDWKVLVTATIVVAADHFLRGTYFPESVFGVAAASQWRWIEHAAWVVFEDVFLIKTCIQAKREMREICIRRANLEILNEEMDAKVTLRTAELARSNQELQQFAYIASHDLQEPLRMVSSYLQLLKKRYQGKLDQSGDEYIHFAVDGALRMKQLINDLLEYSRVGTQRKPPVLTQTETTVDHALSNLKVAIEESDTVITRDPLPAVMADDVQLERLFQNLIGNAIKYRLKDRAPQIHISAKKSDQDTEFTIRDNGIGIAPEHFERIFDIFQRLHTAEEFSGTGIGLSVCRKIVENHGGKIWVESEVGKGSTFHFTLGEKK
ncbi:MAG: ATP-binding protein [Myxococcota bacterium]